MTNSLKDANDIAVRLHRLSGLNQSQIDALSLSLDPVQVDHVSDAVLAQMVNGTLPGLPINPTGGLPLGLPGATQAARFVGGTVSGAPTTGTFQQRDWVVDGAGLFFVCTAGGSPGTWQQLGINTFVAQTQGTIGGSTKLRVGYDGPGKGATADLSVTGAGLAVLGANENRLWANSSGTNANSVRNLADDGTTDSPSTVRFLQGSNGRERMAVGYSGLTPGTGIGPFAGSSFVESSSHINLDGTVDTTRAATPMRFITTGTIPGFGFAPFARIGLEANGETVLYGLSGWDIASAAFKVRIDADTEVAHALRVHATSGTFDRQLKLGEQSQSSGAGGEGGLRQMNLGYDFGIDGGVIDAIFNGSAYKPLHLHPYGGLPFLGSLNTAPDGGSMLNGEIVLYRDDANNLVRMMVKQGSGTVKTLTLGTLS